MGGMKSNWTWANDVWYSSFDNAAKQPNLTAKAFVAALISDNNDIKILAEKNKDDILPIASLTKLVSAIVATDNYDPNKIITITKEAIKDNGPYVSLRIGTKFSVQELVKASLVESNNDAITALANEMGFEKFVNSMNEKAASFGLMRTWFANPTGLDNSNIEENNNNRSTAEELLKLVKEMVNKYPNIISVTKNKNLPIYLENGQVDHTSISTNKLLSDSDFKFEIIGGKTGETKVAGKNMILITKDKKTNSYLVNVVLNSQDHFTDMKNLLDFLY